MRIYQLWIISANYRCYLIVVQAPCSYCSRIESLSIAANLIKSLYLIYHILLMSQFLKENIYSPKHMTQNRVLMLAEKINSLKIGHKADAQRKIDILDKQISDLEADFQRMSVTFNDRNFQLKHIFSKISKELSVDHVETDRSIREEVQKCEEMALDMIQKHVDERKASDARITRFVDDKCAIIRDLIDRQNKQRIMAVKDIQDSLDRDLAEIRDKLQRDCVQRQDKIENIHSQFLEQYEKMRTEFSELSQKYTDSESEFYKMLRDVLKKVKKQIAEGKKERQDMEESILVLIERICDKAMESGQQ